MLKPWRKITCAPEGGGVAPPGGGRPSTFGRQFAQIVFVLQGQFNGLELLGGSLGEVGHGAVLDLALVSIGLPEQNPGVELAAQANLAAIEVHW
jgi:hypothetical protein